MTQFKSPSLPKLQFSDKLGADLNTTFYVAAVAAPRNNYHEMGLNQSGLQKTFYNSAGAQQVSRNNGGGPLA